MFFWTKKPLVGLRELSLLLKISWNTDWQIGEFRCNFY